MEVNKDDQNSNLAKEKEILWKSHDQACAKFLSVWKELEERVESIEERNRVVASKEMELEERSKMLDEREISLEERTRLVESEGMKFEKKKKEELELLVKKIHIKEGVLDLIRGRISDCDMKFTAKDKELGSLFQKFEEKKKEMNSVETEHKKLNEELALKKDELGSVKKLIFTKNSVLQDLTDKIDRRKDELGSVEKSINENVEKLDSIRRSLIDCCGKVEVKKNEFGLVKRSIEQVSAELDLKKNSVEELTREVEVKRGELVSVQNLVEKHCVEVGLKRDELSLLEKLVQDLSEKVEVKKEVFQVINMLLEEGSVGKDELSAIKSSCEKTPSYKAAGSGLNDLKGKKGCDWTPNINEETIQKRRKRCSNSN